ncbi:MAG: hypothetical protein ACJ735_13210 [Actinomycetes bacterium]
MPRRVTLPGAAELFRATSTEFEDPPASRADESEPQNPALAPPHPVPAPPGGGTSGVRTTTRRRSTGDRGPTGRQRHEEKITVYCSPDELFELEQARLTLRGEHGLAVDRGRIVREAVAVVLADLEAKGESSILVRRLRGR